MKVDEIKNFTGGWFVGNFSPTLFSSKEVEVACKDYEAGIVEKAHYHKIATELTLVTEGFAKFVINPGTLEETEKTIFPGQIATIEPGTIVQFHALTNVKTVVVKYPSVKNDKFLTE